MMTQLQMAQAALNAHQRDVSSLGPCLRALRALCAVGRLDQARNIAWEFVARDNMDQRCGDALVAFAQQAPIKRFAPGQSIIKEGQSDDAVYLVLDGEARVRRLGAGEVGTVHGGDFVGEVASVAGTARTASVYARGHVEVLTLPPQALAELARFVPGIYPRLLKTTRERLITQVMGPESPFAGLSAKDKADLFSHFVLGTVNEGTRIIEEGKQGSAVYVIVAGLVEVWRTAAQGDRQSLATLGPGDAFGEVALLTNRPTCATVEAVSPVTYAALDRLRFNTTIRTHPKLTEAFTQLACRRLGVKELPLGGAVVPIAVEELDESIADESMLTTHTFYGTTCQNCGFPDAGAVCIACGHVA